MLKLLRKTTSIGHPRKTTKGPRKGQRDVKKWLISMVVVLGCLSAWAYGATLPLTVPTDQPTYVVPLAELRGEGMVSLKSEIGLVVNAKLEAVGMYYKLPGKAGERSMSELYGLGMLDTPAGIILSGYHGTPLIVLRGKINLQARRNVIQVSYLTSLTNRQYRQCQIYLVQDGAGHWGLVNAYTGRPVTRMIITTHGMGIQTIAGVCQG